MKSYKKYSKTFQQIIIWAKASIILFGLEFKGSNEIIVLQTYS
jgi:hypothetical protein